MGLICERYIPCLSQVTLSSDFPFSLFGPTLLRYYSQAPVICYRWEASLLNPHVSFIGGVLIVSVL